MTPDTTPAPSAEDVAAAYREWRDSLEWHDNDYLAEKREFEAFKQGYAQALARAQQDEGRDAARLKEMAEQGWYLSAHLDGYWEVCVSLGHVVSRGQTYHEAIDAAMRRAEEGSDGREGV